MEIHSRARGVHVAHFRVQCGRISAVVGDDKVIRTLAFTVKSAASPSTTVPSGIVMDLTPLGA